MNQRGISAIVAVVLIVLITVAGVAIIWMAIVPMINEKSDLDNDLIGLNIVTEGGYTFWDEKEKVACVQVERTSDNISLDRIEVLFSFEGNSEKGYFEKEEVPEPNGKRKKCFNLFSYGKPKKVSISPVIDSKVMPISSSNPLTLGGNFDGTADNLYEDYREYCDSVDNNGNGEIDEGCLNCGAKIVNNNVYMRLSKDLVDCPQFGIMIDASNVTLDCDGHEISLISNAQIYESKGKESCSLDMDLNQRVDPSGVVVCRGNTQYNIKNCRIKNIPLVGGYGAGIAIYVENKNDVSVIENNYIYNSHRGMIHWGENDIIRNNVFENITQGIWLDESNGELIYGNLFRNNSNAIWHYCAAYCSNLGVMTHIYNNIFEMPFKGVGVQISGFIVVDNVTRNTFEGGAPYFYFAYPSYTYTVIYENNIDDVMFESEYLSKINIDSINVNDFPNPYSCPVGSVFNEVSFYCEQVASSPSQCISGFDYIAYSGKCIKFPDSNNVLETWFSSWTSYDKNNVFLNPSLPAIRYKKQTDTGNIIEIAIIPSLRQAIFWYLEAGETMSGRSPNSFSINDEVAQESIDILNEFLD